MSGRPEDLSTLAAELCNMGLYVQHCPLVRRAVQLALEGAGGALSARHLASLAQACGVLGNVPKPDMLVRQHLLPSAPPTIQACPLNGCYLHDFPAPLTLLILLHGWGFMCSMAMKDTDMPSLRCRFWRHTLSGLHHS